jgi:hypothetical protein
MCAVTRHIMIQGINQRRKAQGGKQPTQRAGEVHGAQHCDTPAVVAGNRCPIFSDQPPGIRPLVRWDSDASSTAVSLSEQRSSASACQRSMKATILAAAAETSGRSAPVEAALWLSLHPGRLVPSISSNQTGTGEPSIEKLHLQCLLPSWFLFVSLMVPLRGFFLP